MPGPEQRRLTAADRRALAAIERKIEIAESVLEAARVEWAALVREIGIGAVAREKGLTAAAISDRVRLIEKRAER
jgi:hypothetical protein